MVLDFSTNSTTSIYYFTFIMQKRVLFEANSMNPFFRCHISGASNISLVKSNLLRTQVVKLSTSQQSTHLEFMYEKMCSRILYRFLIFRIFISNEQDFKFDLKFSTNERRPLIFTFSTKIQSLSIKKFTVMVPLSTVLRSVWLNLTIDLFSFIHDLNVQNGLKKLKTITVYPFCYLSELSVTSYSISDVSILGNPQTSENNTPEIYQVLNVPKIRLDEWRRAERIDLRGSEDSKDLLKVSQLTTVGNQSCTKSSQSSSVEGERCISGRQNSARKRIFLQINRVCINEQSSTGSSKVPTGPNVSKDPRSFSAGAISNRLTSTAKNSTSLLYYPEENINSNHFKVMNNMKSEIEQSYQQQYDIEKQYQSIRLGSLYLFNSLPQPAPSFFTQSCIKDIETKEIDEKMENRNIVICSKSPYLQRIRIDHHSLKELTDADLKFKVIMASTPYHLNNETPLSNDNTIMGTNENLLEKTAPHKSNINDENDKTVCTPPPINLAGYEQSDDLSASFEASLLASLKQAVLGEAIEPDLQFLSSSKQQITGDDHNNKLRETITTPMTNAKYPHSEISKSIPVPSQSPSLNHLKKNMLSTIKNEKCDIVVALQKQILNVSFSDNDNYNAGDDTTTTDGLGSLIYLRYHLARHHHHQHYEHEDQHLVHERCDGNLLLDMNNQLLTKLKTSTCQQNGYTCREEDDPAILTPSRASSMVHQRTHSTDDVSQLVTGFELSSHWGTETANSSNESISYSVCESITSPLPQSYQLVEHTSSVNQMELQNTGSVNKEVINNNSSDKPFDVNSNHGLIELIYDPILKCYYDPTSGRFYELI
ncbi:unnamed protein product [Schistosoma rodhaini]|uniref:CFA20 domain-containing protein n=1 Tax=Schistosoma rodhaini TaxID=6188 RepID=A0AA85FHJ6_9TREM|nr:unnamed protein product [Schistosoma rodhaini]